VEKKNYDKIRFAMKSLQIEDDFKELVQREYDILKKLDHPFTMNIVEVYCNKSKNELQLILPLYEGGDVYSLI
jgi:serine/threonine protein kinase